MAFIAFLFGLSILWETFIDGKSVPGYPSLVVSVMTIGGVQLLMIGIVGEYIGKILSELKARPIYFVAEHSVRRRNALGRTPFAVCSARFVGGDSAARRPYQPCFRPASI